MQKHMKGNTGIQIVPNYLPGGSIINVNSSLRPGISVLHQGFTWFVYPVNVLIFFKIYISNDVNIMSFVYLVYHSCSIFANIPSRGLCLNGFQSPWVYLTQRCPFSWAVDVCLILKSDWEINKRFTRKNELL